MVATVNGYKPKCIGQTKMSFEELCKDLTARKKIIVDPGKNTVKILVLDENNNIIYFYSFPSLLEPVARFTSDTPLDGQYFVTIKNGKSIPTENGEQRYIDRNYILGTGASSEYIEIEADKNTFHHRLCILTAIHQFVNDGEEVDLIVGYPTSNYQNADLRNQYIDSIMRGEEIVDVLGEENLAPGTIKLTVNGCEKTFYIRDIEVFQEGLGHLTLQAARIKEVEEKQKQKAKAKKQIKPVNTNEDLTTIFIDIGGYNINLHVRKKGTYTDHTSLDKVGINYLHDDLKRAFRSQITDGSLLSRIDTIDWGHVIETNTIFGREDIGGINVYTFLYETIGYFIDKKVIRAINKELDLNIGNNDQIELVFLGGGSKRINRFIDHELEGKKKKGLISFSPVPVWDNVLSYAFLYFNKKAELLMKSGIPKAEWDRHMNEMYSLTTTTRYVIASDCSNEEYVKKATFKPSFNSIHSLD